MGELGETAALHPCEGVNQQIRARESARLDRRDGKPHYLAHLPRVERYLAKDLSHPDLASLRAWYAEYLPRAMTSHA